MKNKKHMYNSFQTSSGLFLLIFSVLIVETYTYDTRCPTRPEWNNTAKIMCQLSDDYFCLLDELNMKHTEDCTSKREWEAPGREFEYRGNFNGRDCHKSRYQPYTFWTNGSSECEFLKSLCSEEGQICFSNGEAYEDRLCSCDQTNGYAFVQKIYNQQYCLPAVEDCSCYNKQCNSTLPILTSDYLCKKGTSIGNHKLNDTCGLKGSSTFRSPNSKQENEVTKLNDFYTNISSFVSERLTKEEKVLITTIICFAAFCGVILICLTVYNWHIENYVEINNDIYENLQEDSTSTNHEEAANDVENSGNLTVTALIDSRIEQQPLEREIGDTRVSSPSNKTDEENGDIVSVNSPVAEQGDKSAHPQCVMNEEIRFDSSEITGIDSVNNRSTIHASPKVQHNNSSFAISTGIKKVEFDSKNQLGLKDNDIVLHESTETKQRDVNCPNLQQNHFSDVRFNPNGSENATDTESSGVDTSYVFRNDLNKHSYSDNTSGLSKNLSAINNIQAEQTPQKLEKMPLQIQQSTSTVERVPIGHTNVTSSEFISEMEENFLKFVMLVFKVAQYALETLLSYQLSRLTTKTLPELVNKNQHDIYHKCYPNAPCCQCNGIVSRYKYLTPQQLDMLIDKGGERLPQHKQIEGDKSNFCCFPAKQSIKPHELHMTLLRFLLINYCDLDESVSKAIDNLLFFRNSVSHTTCPEIENGEYVKYRQEILESLKIISNYCQTKKIECRLEEAERMRPGNDLLHEIFPTRVKWESKERKKHLIDITEAQVKDSLATYRVVEITAMRDGMSRLNESGLLVLTGAAGTGKSTCSHYLLREFCENNKEYKMLIVPTLEELNDVLCIDDKLIFLFDDIFGKSNVTFNENVHSSILSRIRACILKQNIKVIITLRNTIYEKCADLFQKDKLFQVQHIDLSSKAYQMSKAERKKCLKSHLRMFKRSIIDGYVKGGNAEKGSCITKDAINNIADVNINPLIGFPEACYLFTSNDRFLSQGVDFFKHPTNQLLKEIDKLRGWCSKESQLKYSCLVAVMLANDNVINIYDNNIVLKISDIMKSVYNEQSPCPELFRIADAFSDLCGKYLSQKEYGIYEFQHRVIFEAVLTSYAKTNIVFDRMDFDFIIEMTWPQTVEHDDEKCVLHIPEQHYRQLAFRLLNIFKSKQLQDRKWSFTKSVCSWPMIRYTKMKFLYILFEMYEKEESQVISNNSRENAPFYLPAAVLECLILFDDQEEAILNLLDKFKQLLHEPQYGNMITLQEACKKAISNSLVKVCQTGMTERLKEIWEFSEKLQLQLDFHKCLQRAVQYKQLDTFNWVRKKAQINDCKPYVKDACKSGFLKFVETFCSVSDFNDLTDECHEACVVMEEPIMEWFKTNAMEKVDRRKLLLNLSRENNIEAVQWLINNDNEFNQHIHDAVQEAEVSNAKQVYNFLDKRH